MSYFSGIKSGPCPFVIDYVRAKFHRYWFECLIRIKVADLGMIGVLDLKAKEFKYEKKMVSN